MLRGWAASAPPSLLTTWVGFQQLPAFPPPFSHPPAAESRSSSRPSAPAPGGDSGSSSRASGKAARTSGGTVSGRDGGGLAHGPWFPSIATEHTTGEGGKKHGLVAEGKKELKDLLERQRFPAPRPPPR